MEFLNEYGDTLPEDSGRHGANIASQRLDDLDIECLEYCLSLKRKDGKTSHIALDLGSGDGIQALRIGLLGFETHLYDRTTSFPDRLNFDEIYPILSVPIHLCDLSKSDEITIPAGGVDLVYSQRFIHYLTFDQARALLTKISNFMSSDGHLFLSATGRDSEIGKGHPQKNEVVENRFEFLDECVATKHSIYEKICVYTCDDLERLCQLSGFQKVRVWNSSFGNVKGVFRTRTSSV